MMEVIRLNNSGVLYLQAGRFREALIDFKRAAEMMYKTDDEQDEIASSTEGSPAFQHPAQDGKFEDDNSSVHRADEEDSHRRKRARLSVQQEQTPPTAVSHAPRVAEVKEICFLRITPFTIPTDKIPEYTEVSTVILFNMGLTYQMSYSQCFALPKSIENASTLYIMAGSIAMKHLDDPVFMRLLMATLNNLAFLYYELGDYQLSRDYFDEISRCILNMSPRAASPEVLMEKNQLILNTMVLREPHVARAA